VARILLSTWIAAIGVLAFTPAASAATVEAGADLLYFAAGSGEANEVTFALTSHGRGTLTIRVADAGADLEAGSGCVAVTAREASCEIHASPGSRFAEVLVYLGDEDDSLIADIPCYLADIYCEFSAHGEGGNDHLVGRPDEIDDLYGGEGNDLLEGRAGAECAPGPRPRCDGDRLFGDPGDDLLRGGAGNDQFDPGEGADSIHGGAGRYDKVWYHLVVGAGVRVELDDLANDGPPGEHDNARSDVEVVFGSPGDDTLIGTTRRNVLEGALGNDRIFGRGGNDRLSGSWGTDLVVGGRGNDHLFLGRGRDRGYGRTGDDSIYAREQRNVVPRVVDTIDGGSGSDRARVNRRDRVSRIEKFVP
jgi:Ca2+-binding RTX toxin-like protein